jgi:hypothetical protein
MPVMYDRNAGYNGNVHGEIKLKKPAANAKNTFTSVFGMVVAPYIVMY